MRSGLFCILSSPGVFDASSRKSPRGQLEELSIRGAQGAQRPEAFRRGQTPSAPGAGVDSRSELMSEFGRGVRRPGGCDRGKG